MKVLISAYECRPDVGSEPEAALRTVEIAAALHDVWVITQTENVALCEAYFDRLPDIQNRVHFVGLQLDGRVGRLRDGGFFSLRWHYDKWQRKVAVVAGELDRGIDFDLVHHVTYATYWARTGVADFDKPLVWGPIGGGSLTPLALLPALGWKGFFVDALRTIGRPIASGRNGAKKTAARAAVVIAQNPHTLRRLGSPATGFVFPNATGVVVPRLGDPLERTTDIVFAGNLIALKACALAIRAMRYVTHPSCVLQVFGDGPEQNRLERLVTSWGVSDRVRFHGRIPRASLLEVVGRAGVFFHPALHDEAPLGVAEALTLGTPVVCLTNSGPAVLAGLFPDSPSAVIDPGFQNHTAKAMARAIDHFLFHPARVSAEPCRPLQSFDSMLLKAYSMAVGEST